MGFLSWVIIAAALLLFFVIVLFMGIVRRSINTVLFSVLLCIVGLGAGCAAVYKFFKGVKVEVKKATKGRSAMEVYSAVFGPAGNDCVQALDYFDPVVPVMNDQLSICFKACPVEVRRILSGGNYSIVRQSQKSVSTGQCCADCFTAAKFGDTVLAGTNGDRHIYISLDSTHVFYYDVDN